MKSHQSYQLECYSLESPVSCSVLPLYIKIVFMNKDPQPNEKISLSNSFQQPPFLEITLWDNKRKIQNYTIENLFQKSQNQTPEQALSMKKGDTKSHKFGIKRAYKMGAYTIILDEDRIVTVRKGWEIQECFTDVEDIVYFRTESMQLIEKEGIKDQKIEDNQKIGNKALNLCNNSSIFILNRRKFRNDKVSFDQELIILSVRNGEKSEVQGGKSENVMFKVIQLSPKYTSQTKTIYKPDQEQKEGLQLSSNGKWAISGLFVYWIQIKKVEEVQRNANTTSQSQNIAFQDYFRTQIKLIDRMILSEKLQQKIDKLLWLDKNLIPNLWSIVYLNHQGTLCSGQFLLGKTFSDIQITNNTSLNNKVKLFKNSPVQSVEQQITFLSVSNSKHQNMSTRLIFILQNSTFIIYEVQLLKFVCSIDISQNCEHQLSKNSGFILNHKNHAWIFDQSNMVLHKINLKSILQQYLSGSLNKSLTTQREQLLKGHENTVKLLNLRLKILKLLSAYLQNKIQPSKDKLKNETSTKNPDYSSCIRLLNKQQNISILNDGITYLMRFIFDHNETAHILQARINSNLTIRDFEEGLIKLVNKLVLSKYQSHVENGLNLLIQLFTYFSIYYQGKDSPSKGLYVKIEQSSRIQKLLTQENKKKIWELAYMFTVKLQNTHLSLH